MNSSDPVFHLPESVKKDGRAYRYELDKFLKGQTRPIWLLEICCRRTCSFINLVTAEEQEIWLIRSYVRDDVVVWEPHAPVPGELTAVHTAGYVVVAGERSDNDLALVDRILLHGSVVVVLHAGTTDRPPIETTARI